MIGRDLGLELPRRKPLGTTRVNPQHPLARGLVFASLLTEDGHPRDLIQSRVATGAPTTIRNTLQGQALLFNGSSDACNFGDTPTYRPGSQLWTIMVYANPAFASATYGMLSKRNNTTFSQLSFAANMDNGGGTASGLLGLYLYDGSNTLAAAATTSPVNGAFHQFVAQRTGASTLAFSVDGVSLGVNYSATGNPNYTGTEPVFVGAMGGTSAPAGGYFPGNIVYAYVWRGRVLTAIEINWLVRDPYAFVREAPRQEPWLTIWVPSAGGGTTYTLSGSTTQAQSLSLSRQLGFQRTLTASQAQSVALQKQPRLTRALAQAQSLSMARAVTLTRLLTQTQVALVTRALQLTRSLTTATTASLTFLRLGTTYPITVSSVVAQVLSLVAQTQVSPPPTPVAVPSPAPASGIATSNYLDWPLHTITSTDSPPPVGTAIGGP